MSASMTAPVETAATITDVTPEVLAAMRHAAIPVPSANGAAAPDAEPESLQECAARLLKTGTSLDALAAIDAGERDRDDALARIAAASARLGEWFAVAEHAHVDGMKGAEWQAMTGTTPQEYGRLRGAAMLYNAYGKRGATFRITEAEAKRLADSKGIGKCEVIAAEVARKVDPIDVRGFRKAGKAIRGNAAIVAGSLAPVAKVDPEPVAPVAPVVPEGSNNGTPVATDDAPSLSTPAAPVAANGTTDTAEVFTMPVVTDWVRVVEGMGANAHVVAKGKRDSLRQAAIALVAALDTLDGIPAE